MIVENLPSWLAYALPEISLLLVGIAVEKYYVSRVTCFTNVMAVNVHILSLERVGSLLGIYADIGLIIGVYGFLAYIVREGTGELYDLFAFFLYSSMTVGCVIFLPFSFWINVFIGIGSQLLLAVTASSEDNFIYTGPRPAPLNDFIDTKSIVYTDEYGRRQEERLSNIFRR